MHPPLIPRRQGAHDLQTLYTIGFSIVLRGSKQRKLQTNKDKYAFLRFFLVFSWFFYVFPLIFHKGRISKSTLQISLTPQKSFPCRFSLFGPPFCNVFLPKTFLFLFGICGVPGDQFRRQPFGYFLIFCIFWPPRQNWDRRNRPQGRNFT